MNRLILAASTLLLGSAACMAADTEGAMRIPVIEEATSVGCGWCVRGLFTLEYIAEAYPGTFIPLAYHSDFDGTRDPMVSESGEKWINRYAKGSFPYAVVNRKEPSGVSEFMNFYEIKPYVDNLYEQLRSERVFAGVEVAATPSEAGEGNLDVEVTVNYPLDIPGGRSERYQIAIAVSEDGLGPYQQKNYYSGSAYDGNGYEDRANKPKIKHDHVVLELYGLPAISGSVPAGLAKGDTHTYRHTVDVSRASGESVNVVAMLVDTDTDEIVNAAGMVAALAGESPENPETPGLGAVDTVDASSAVSVEVRGSAVVIAGNSVGEARVYKVDGTLVAVVNAPATIELLPGIYVVKCDSQIRKVCVR